MLNTDQLINVVGNGIDTKIESINSELNTLSASLEKVNQEDAKGVSESMAMQNKLNRLNAELVELKADREVLKARAEKFWNAEHLASWSSKHLDVINPLLADLQRANAEAINIDGLVAFMGQVKEEATKHQGNVDAFEHLCKLEPMMAKAI